MSEACDTVGIGWGAVGDEVLFGVELFEFDEFEGKSGLYSAEFDRREGL